MLNSIFNALIDAHGEDYFTSRVNNNIIQNINPKFDLREYQKEALGRFDFYYNGYNKRKNPSQLLFNMATGSGKTLIMAVSILYLYDQGYRNFIFFVNSLNIIEKTRDNFLNPLSEKYLFAPRIKFGEKEVRVVEVSNFETTHPEDISIIFSTIHGLHSRLNKPRENSVTYEDFEEKEVVLISDEEHHLNTLTKLKRKNIPYLFKDNTESISLNGLSKTEKEEFRSWEGTVQRIVKKNSKNILLQFTATIELENENIKAKYDDKIIYKYDLKQFRLDKYSKEIEVLQADLEPIDRALQAVILSQYRRKVAEKHKIRLKPVILFKSNRVTPPTKQRNKDTVVSKEFKEEFLGKIENLTTQDIDKFKNVKSETITEAFKYFEKNKITTANLIKEIQNDFDETKCLSIDSSVEIREKQILVNSLEDKNNEIRAVFAVEMLNEGWDVLNLFDIVRLYNTLDAKAGKPGKTTIKEAQLIGRGARYYPFKLTETQEFYKRKYDDDIDNELRILEKLYYHSAHNPKYIQELHKVLVGIGIVPAKSVERKLIIKDDFKKTDFWKKGVIFLNDRVENGRLDIKGLDDADISREFRIALRTGLAEEEEILSEDFRFLQEDGVTSKKTFRATDFGSNVWRSAIDKLDFFHFSILKRYFPHLNSISEFISDSKYLGNIEIIVSGNRQVLKNLTPRQKQGIAIDVLQDISKGARTNTTEYIGKKEFRAEMLRSIFKDKILKLDGDSEKAKGMSDSLNLLKKDWYAQNDNFGTSEEKSFILFMDDTIEKLQKKYKEIALLRNERFFQIFNFEDGQGFEPDFVLLLKKENSNNIEVLQIFIEPKGNQFKDSSGGFEKSKEGWKQKFLLELEEKSEIIYKQENKDFRLLGLPFYNENMKQDFKDDFYSRLLDN